MISSELIKIFKSSKFKIVLSILIIIALVNSFTAIFIESKAEYVIEEFGQNNPTYFSLLASGSTYSILRIFNQLMPIYLMLSYCDCYTNELKTGVAILHSTKQGRRKYYFSKILSAFIFPFVLCSIPHLINLAINSIFLYGGTNFDGLQLWSKEELGNFLYNCINHPYTTYFIFLFINLLVFGLLAVMCQSLCFIFKDNRIVYILSLTIWIGIYFSNRIFGISFVLQPFACINFKPIIYSFLAFLPSVFIPMIIAYFCVVKRKDEI